MPLHWLARFLAAWLLLLLGPALAAEPPGNLRWDREHRRVDANFHDWPLDQVLERIASATNWRVLVEPGLNATVAARFEQRSEREALALLLGDLNFALLPGRDTPSRLLVFRSQSSLATVPIEPRATSPGAPESSQPIPNELIVRLKPDASITIEELARRLGARMAGSIDSLDAHRLVFDDAEAADSARALLAADDDVASVEANHPLSLPSRIDPLPGAIPPPLGLRARPITDGSSVIVALLDTSLPHGGLAHPDFLLPTVSLTPPSGVPTEGLTHASGMFETILQGLSVTQSGPDGTPVRILPIDIYGGRSQTSTFELAQGIVAALERGADILNLSLSGPNPSPVVQDVLRQASAAGVLAFAAPGNQPTGTPTYPAAYPDVLAVTASDHRGQIAPYANRGTFVDLIAPGTSIVPHAGEAFVVQGTSVSTAYASGLAAGLLAQPNTSPSTVTTHLHDRIGFRHLPP
ncbi:MAG: S8 family serine peptidase [Verrucomicrobiae bacterium]|nr:S8 family serine peptidase [Verrucomicrobiae bacterium]